MRIHRAILWSGIFGFLGSVVLADGNFVPKPVLDCKSILNGFMPCKTSSPVKYETKRYNFPSSDFDWSCNYGNLEFNFFNSSNQIVRNVVIEGTTNNTRLTESVIVPPGKSERVFTLQGKFFCRNEKQARLYFEYTITYGGECLSRYSDAEKRKMIERCTKEVAIEKERDIIFNNCVVAKSKGVDQRAMGNVRSVCREISNNPTTLQRWRWGQ